MRVLVTGAAGFIGFHLSERLLKDGDTVIGFDNLNHYYDVKLKEDRIGLLSGHSEFYFCKGSLEKREDVFDLFRENPPELVVHLAAQAGVRYSLENPHAYIDSNITGFLNILEACRQYGVNKLIYASSSSVYGNNTKVPFSVEDNVDHPISLYAATKKSNELMAYTYSHLFQMNVTGLRFFTVYGPWGRPDMAYFSFTKAILEEKPIKVFNHGDMLRDFTYIDDVVEGIVRLLRRSQPSAQYELFNIGNHSPVEVNYFIQVIEKAVGKSAIKEYLPMQPGDVPATYADVTALENCVGFKPDTSIEEGIKRFVSWYQQYYSDLRMGKE